MLSIIWLILYYILFLKTVKISTAKIKQNNNFEPAISVLDAN